MVIPVFTRTGNLARWVASQLLAKDSVFSGVQRAFLGSLDARRAVDRNIGRVLAGLNLPSHQEVERLYDDVRELEREVSALTRRAERLARR
jgi:polyhydroxyalkanoate synthesis regulator phasin